MIKKINKLTKSQFFFPAVLFVLSFICYGMISPWMKFFHDEISILMFYQKMNDLGLFFEGNRPFLKYFYQPFLFLFGSNALVWAAFGVIIRWLHALSFYWLINQVFPDEKYASIASSLLIIVFPGFQAQSSAMIYSLTFLIFSLFILSLFFSVKYILNKKLIFLLTSLLYSAISLFTSEYFFTLELIRYVLIWIILKKRDNQVTIKNTFLPSIPYLLLYIPSIIWRLISEGNETTYSLVLIENLKTSFFPTIFQQLIASLKDLWYTSVHIWLNSFFPSHLYTEQGTRIIFFYYVIIICIFSFLYLNRKQLFTFSNSPFKANKSLITFGIISLILAGFPFWLASLPVNEKYFYTRWTIPFMVGSCILLPQLTTMIFRKKSLVIIIISAFISLGAGTQFIAANSFRHDWEKQNNFFWELIWRIPDLEKQTILFSDYLNFNYENSDHISSGINFALSGNQTFSEIPYFLFYLPERINTSILPEIKKDIPINAKRYYSSFTGNTSQAIIIDYQPPTCLKVLDPVIDNKNANIHSLSRKALPLSNLSLISLNESRLIEEYNTDIIGSEPDKNWCYYFEKADLANQFEDWKTIDTLFQEVELNNFLPRDGREWFPFIEGLSHSLKWEEAEKLTDQSLGLTDNLEPMLCSLWERINQKTPNSYQKQQILQEIYNKLNCE